MLNEAGRSLGIWMRTGWVIWAEKLKAVLDRNVGFKTAAHGKASMVEEAGENVRRRAMMDLTVTRKSIRSENQHTYLIQVDNVR